MEPTESRSTDPVSPTPPAGGGDGDLGEATEVFAAVPPEATAANDSSAVNDDGAGGEAGIDADAADVAAADAAAEDYAAPSREDVIAAMREDGSAADSAPDRVSAGVQAPTDVRLKAAQVDAAPTTVIATVDDRVAVGDDADPDDADPDDTEPHDTEPHDTEPDDTEPDDTEPDDTEPKTTVLDTVEADGDEPTAVLPSVRETAPLPTTEPIPVATSTPVAEPAHATTSIRTVEPTPPTAPTPAAAPSRAQSSAAPPSKPASASPTAKKKRRKAPWIVAGVVVLLAIAYVTIAWFFSDKVANGTTVAGVDIGGLTAQEAEARLDETLGAQARQPVQVVVADATAAIDPDAAGLTFSAEQTVRPLVGFSLNPSDLWKHVSGSNDVEPVTSEDQTTLAAQLDEVAGQVDVDPVEGAITMSDGVATVTEPATGIALDIAKSLPIVTADWLTGASPIDLPFTATEPTIGVAEVQRAQSEILDVISSGPVTVDFDGITAELPSEAILQAASINANGDRLELTLDQATIEEQVKARIPDGVETTATNATFAFQDGVPVIVPGTPGRVIDMASLVSGVSTAAQSPTDRTVAVVYVDSQPEQDAAALEALGVKEIVSEFSTKFPYDPQRTDNLRLAAQKITGTLVKPGETFSLTQVLGPVDAAHGYKEAMVIQNGEHVDGMGGGLSQVSTTVYNASHLAGFEDVEHRPHSVYFTRYPAGREATIWIGQIDNKFKNNTPYGALMQAWVDDSDRTIHVAVWSTKYWEVDSQIGPKTNVVPATVVHKPAGAGCTPMGAGQSGFSVTVTRTLSLNGEVKDTQQWKWTYRPDNGVACDEPPAGG